MRMRFDAASRFVTMRHDEVLVIRYSDIFSFPQSLLSVGLYQICKIGTVSWRGAEMCRQNRSKLLTHGKRTQRNA